MRLMTIVAVLATAILAPAGSALAQSAEDNVWFKVCSNDQRVKKDICLVTQEVRTPGGQVLASAAVRGFVGEKRRSLLLVVPTGMVIDQGVHVQIDGGDAEKAEYQICLQHACWAERPVNDDFVSKLKAGSKMVLSAYNREGKKIDFDMSLAGFTAAYDGDPLAPEQVAEMQKTLQEDLERKQEVLAAKLRDAQRKAVQAAVND